MKNTTVKKSLILVVALVLCLTVALAACSPKQFTPVEAVAGGQTVEGNGGIAVKYGEWLYYINGYTSATDSTNTYTDDVKTTPRVGSVVRIKLAEIENLFEIQDDKNKTSTIKSEEIDAYLRGENENFTSKHGAETVVPRFYYSGSTETRLTGLYIFGDRLYITTPNDELTAGGDTLTNQLVLTSYKLDGSDEQRHFVFTGNAPQIWLTEKDGKVVATYVLDNVIYKLDVATGTSTEVSVNGEDKAPDADNVAQSGSIHFDFAGKCIFFIDKMYDICKLDLGADKYDVIVENGTADVHEHDGTTHVEAGNLTYTITAVNNGQVYYTKADSEHPINSSTTDPRLFWASSTQKESIAFNKNDMSGTTPWKDGKLVYVQSITSDTGTFYGIYVTQDQTGDAEPSVVLIPAYNDSSVTIDRIEGDTLYYTANSISYTIDLTKGEEQEEGIPYAKSLASAAGWAAPDFVENGDTHYIITATTAGALTITKFDPTDASKTQSSVSLLLKAAPVEE